MTSQMPELSPSPSLAPNSRAPRPPNVVHVDFTRTSPNPIDDQPKAPSVA